MNGCGFWLQRLSKADRSVLHTVAIRGALYLFFFFLFVPQLDYLATDLKPLLLSMK